MEGETTENDIVDPSDTNTNNDSNLEKESSKTTDIEKNESEKNADIEKESIKTAVIEAKDSEKIADIEKESIETTVIETKDSEKIADIEIESIDTAVIEPKGSIYTNTTKAAISNSSIATEVSADADGENIFGDADDDTQRTETAASRTQATIDASVTSTTENLSNVGYSQDQRLNLFNISMMEAEYEEDDHIDHIAITETIVEEEEDVDIYGYLQGFTRAAHEIDAPSLAILERQANEAELFKMCETQAQTRRKYAILNKKISEYFKKKKMDRVFEDISPDFYNPMMEKYERKIDEFNYIYNEWTREKTATDTEINEMIKLRTDNEALLKKNLKALTVREKEIGNILLETGAVQEKVVERLISRQKTKSGKMAIVRIAYIKQRDKVKKIEMRIKELETIGGNFHLMDFEQLRMENTIYSDKIEERDEELMRLRDRYSHAIQALAHIREKCSVMEAKIEDTKEENTRTEDTVSEIREKLNDLKIQRDTNRSQTHKLKVDSGLLNYPSLLIDMESSLKIADIYRNQLESIQAAYKDHREKLKAIRYSIEQQSGRNNNLSFRKGRTSKSSGQSQSTGSRQIRFAESIVKKQYDKTMAAMKNKVDKIFADKNCCPTIPKTTIAETMDPMDL